MMKGFREMEESKQGQVEYRPFEPDDFDDLADVATRTWFDDLGEEESRLVGAIYLADDLRRTTFSQVAVVDGRPLGFILARAGEADPEADATWREVLEEVERELRERAPVEAEKLIADAELERRTYAEALNGCTCDKRYEFVLFIVAPEARGLGLGRELFGCAEAYLAAQGAREAYLETDDGCNWGFYEHRGLKRVGELHPTEEEQGQGRLLPGYYIYVDELA